MGTLSPEAVCFVLFILQRNSSIAHIVIKYWAITLKELSRDDSSQHLLSTYSLQNTAHTSSNLLLANDPGRQVVKETKVKELSVKSRKSR